jgi:hypothetical protein
MKKVLIITYYWPPAGGPGVQRILKFAKYLPQYNWQPIVLTVKQGEYPAIDHSLTKEIDSCIQVVKTNSLEPGIIYKKFTGLKKEDQIPVAVLAEEEENWRKKIAHWIRLNLFIPDAKIGWLPFAIYKGKNIIRDEKPEIIFSSSPPPTVHLIARKLKKYSGLKWVADFRDPWTDIHYYENKPRLKWIENMDKKLEHSILDHADKIVCISKLDIEMYFKHRIQGDKCIHIPNGYDESDFKGIQPHGTSGDIFHIIHLGAAGKERNPTNLFKAIKKLSDKSIIHPGSFCLTFIGKVEQEVMTSFKEYSILDYIKCIPYLPHKEALNHCVNASIMLLLITQSEKNIRILPGKTFEYMRLGIPLLALGPEKGEVARILNESKAGKVIDYKNEQDIYDFILKAYRKWSNKEENLLTAGNYIQRYERKNLTGELALVFNDIIGDKK